MQMLNLVILVQLNSIFSGVMKYFVQNVEVLSQSNL